MKFKDMPIGEIFVAHGDKFLAVAEDKEELTFEKVDEHFAREIIDLFGDQREGTELVHVDLDEEHPCTWET